MTFLNFVHLFAAEFSANTVLFKFLTLNINNSIGKVCNSLHIEIVKFRNRYLCLYNIMCMACIFINAHTYMCINSMTNIYIKK